MRFFGSLLKAYFSSDNFFYNLYLLNWINLTFPRHKNTPKWYHFSVSYLGVAYQPS